MKFLKNNQFKDLFSTLKNKGINLTESSFIPSNWSIVNSEEECIDPSVLYFVLEKTEPLANEYYLTYTADGITSPVNEVVAAGENKDTDAQILKSRLTSLNKAYKNIDISIKTKYDFLEDLSYLFTPVNEYGIPTDEANNFKSIDLSEMNTSNVTNMSGMFRNSSNLTSINFSNIDTSKVIDMNCMFYNCKKLTSFDISNFNTSNVTNMWGMFYGCSSLTALDLSTFDVSKVTDMNEMFRYCNFTDTTTVLNLAGWDTSNVTNISGMFGECFQLQNATLNFNTSNVTDMSSMFENCNKLKTLNISSFDMSKVTTLDVTFAEWGENASVAVDLSAFNFSSLKSMFGTFLNYSGPKLDLSSIDFTKLETWDNAFDGVNEEYDNDGNPQAAKTQILVKDNTQKQWITNHFPNLRNVSVK